MFYYHWHLGILGISKTRIEFQIKRSVSTGTLFQLEGILFLQADILQVAAAYCPFELVEAFMQELIIEEIALR